MEIMGFTLTLAGVVGSELALKLSGSNLKLSLGLHRPGFCKVLATNVFVYVYYFISYAYSLLLASDYRAFLNHHRNLV